PGSAPPTRARSAAHPADVRATPRRSCSPPQEPPQRLVREIEMHHPLVIAAGVGMMVRGERPVPPGHDALRGEPDIGCEREARSRGIRASEASPILALDARPE